LGGGVALGRRPNTRCQKLGRGVAAVGTGVATGTGVALGRGFGGCESGAGAGAEAGRSGALGSGAAGMFTFGVAVEGSAGGVAGVRGGGGGSACCASRLTVRSTAPSGRSEETLGMTLRRRNRRARYLPKRAIRCKPDAILPGAARPEKRPRAISRRFHA
jgi:hypothetical protein